MIQLCSRVVHMLRIFFNQRTPKIKISGDILVLSSDDVSLVVESSVHFNPDSVILEASLSLSLSLYSSLSLYLCS